MNGQKTSASREKEVIRKDTERKHQGRRTEKKQNRVEQATERKMKGSEAFIP